jgi:hypothetical protein
MAGSIISLADGSAMTASFRRKFPNETKAVYYSSDVYNDLYAGKVYDYGYRTPPGPIAPNPLNS